MIYLVVGDLQAKKSNLHQCEVLFAEVEFKHKLPTIWLGDMLDKRGHIEAECLNALYKYFQKSSLKHIILVGNHDQVSTHSQEHALEPLKALPNVTIVDKPTVIGNIVLVPYTRNGDEFKLWLSLTMFQDKDYLFCHQGIKEFTLGSGYTEDEAVAIEDVEGFKLVVAGHYHSPMERENVIYVGSPFSHSFGESNEQKRLMTFDDSTGEVKYIKCDKFPRHISYEYNLPLKQEMGPFLKFGEAWADYYRVIVHGNEQEFKDFQKISDQFPGIRFIYKPKGALGSAVITESMTNHDKFIKWAKEIKKLDEDTLKLGLELLNA